MTHATEEELALYHAGLLPAEIARKVTAHLSACARCRAIVEDAARGLAILANASEPPADLLQHARARRWAAKSDDTPIGLPFEDAEDVAEVSGRGLEEDETRNGDSEEGSESDDGGEP
jgi:anti-sigma factor RsiW